MSTPPMPPPDKTCATCGRRIDWRKKWARSWDEVKFCSDGCRRSKPGDVGLSFEEAIVEMLSKPQIAAP